MHTTLSTKGQVVIPVEIRRQLGLGPSSRFRVSVHDGTIVLTPVEASDWRTLRGVVARGISLTEDLEQERALEKQRERAP